MRSEATLRKERVVASALWAAYGDALGFITELVPAGIVKKRVGTARASATVAWSRSVGGRLGAEVTLPAGAYSDDTQLRLATARAIRSDGSFDVESFAKVELPLWLAYALGAGRGSKVAAAALGGRKANWFSNFFDSEQAVYVNGGGNGAAMRIQPHVWAARDLRSKTYLLDVVRNAVCTHGHVRGIAGALVHAASLGSALGDGEVIRPGYWSGLSDVIAELPQLVALDPDLSTFWLPAWEARTGRSLRDAVREVRQEWVDSAKVALRCRLVGGFDGYREAVEALGGLTNAERGSGLKTALLSVYAAHEMREEGCAVALSGVANVLNSDTDTIATMAGAILGALPGNDFGVPDIQDMEYLTAEASRLFQVAVGDATQNFEYPDLLYWQAPRPVDALATVGGRAHLVGLGPVEAMGAEFEAAHRGTVYQWFRTEFGQTILCKRRRALREQKAKSLYQTSLAEPVERVASAAHSLEHQRMPPAYGPDLFNVDATLSEMRNAEVPTVDVATEAAIRSGFDPETVGKMLLAICGGDNGIERAIAFAAIIAKAKEARAKRRNSR